MSFENNYPAESDVQPGLSQYAANGNNQTGPRKSALWFGIVSIAVIAVGVLFIFISNEMVADTGYAIISVLIFLPVFLLIAGALGVVAIILAIVVASKAKNPKKHWVTPLVLGIIGVLVAPTAVLIVVWGAG